MLGRVKQYVAETAINYIFRNTQRAFNSSIGMPLTNINWALNKPEWISLSEPSHYEKAFRQNPIVNSVICLLAQASSNGRKVAIDINSGEIIPWTDKRKAIQNAYKLLVERPNLLQSAKEFQYQRIIYKLVFGNAYVYPFLPSGFDKEIDIENIVSLTNLPSQNVVVKTTGKRFDQTQISDIIEGFYLTDVTPPKKFDPNIILHFNDVNVSTEHPGIVGIPKMESLKIPITNVQKAFEAMNTMLTHRGSHGIISPDKKDGMGHMVIGDDEKIEMQKVFKKEYGLQLDQSPFVLSPVPLNFVKTSMNSKELGIYDEYGNNAKMIANGFNVPPGLISPDPNSGTYENQSQYVRSLYQEGAFPLVEDEDIYWTYRLNTANHGFRISSTWDHIPALAESFKETSSALMMKGKTANEAWKEDIITRNQYLEMIDLPPIDGGDVIRSEWIKTETQTENNEGQIE